MIPCEREWSWESFPLLSAEEVQNGLPFEDREILDDWLRFDLQALRLSPETRGLLFSLAEGEEMTNEKVKAFLATAAGKAQLAAIANAARRASSMVGVSPEAAVTRVEERPVHMLPGGMCCRFAREAHEVALGLPDGAWPFHAATAREAEEKLRAAGRETSGSEPGFVACFDDGSVGHVLVYLGGGMVAENTSSHRGSPSRPGTKRTPLSEVIAAHGGHSGRWYFAGRVPE